jgi:hypothetical protein
LYVVPFDASPSISAQVATSVTSDIETALVSAGCVDVLERRNLDQLVQQVRNERRLSTIRDFGTDGIAQLRRQGATGVLFGEIDDDVNSGEIIVRGKIESFDSTILWTSDVSFTRGLLNDRTTRVNAAKHLLDSVCRGFGNPRSANGAEPSGGVDPRPPIAPPDKQTQSDRQLVTVVFRPRNRSEGLLRLRVAVNGTNAGDLVFAPKPQTLQVTAPPGEWVIDYQLIGVDFEQTHSYREQFGREFFVEASGSFLVDGYYDRSGGYAINITRDNSPFP